MVFTFGQLWSVGEDLVKNKTEDDQVDADDDDHGQEVAQVDHRVVQAASEHISNCAMMSSQFPPF